MFNYINRSWEYKLFIDNRILIQHGSICIHLIDAQNVIIEKSL